MVGVHQGRRLQPSKTVRIAVLFKILSDTLHSSPHLPKIKIYLPFVPFLLCHLDQTNSFIPFVNFKRILIFLIAKTRQFQVAFSFRFIHVPTQKNLPKENLNGNRITLDHNITLKHHHLSLHTTTLNAGTTCKEQWWWELPTRDVH